MPASSQFDIPGNRFLPPQWFTKPAGEPHLLADYHHTTEVTVGRRDSGSPGDHLDVVDQATLAGPYPRHSCNVQGRVLRERHHGAVQRQHERPADHLESKDATPLAHRGRG